MAKVSKEQKTESKLHKIAMEKDNPKKLLMVALSSREADTVTIAINRLEMLRDKKGAQAALAAITDDPHMSAAYRCNAALGLRDEAKKKQIIKANIVEAMLEKFASGYRYGEWMEAAEDPALFLSVIPRIQSYEYSKIEAMVKGCPDRKARVAILAKAELTLGISDIAEEVDLTPEEWLELAKTTPYSNNASVAIRHLGPEYEEEITAFARDGNPAARRKLCEINVQKYDEYIVYADNKARAKGLKEHLLSQRALKALAVEYADLPNDMICRCIEQLNDEQLLGDLLLEQGSMNHDVKSGFVNYYSRIVDKLRNRPDILTKFALQKNGYWILATDAVEYIDDPDSLYQIACTESGAAYPALIKLPPERLQSLIEDARDKKIRDEAQEMYDNYRMENADDEELLEIIYGWSVKVMSDSAPFEARRIIPAAMAKLKTKEAMKKALYMLEGKGLWFTDAENELKKRLADSQ